MKRLSHSAGFSMIEILATIPITIIVISSIATLTRNLHSRNLSLQKKDFLQAQIASATEHLIRIGRHAAECQKTLIPIANTTATLQALDCKFDFDNDASPPNFPNVRFDVGNIGIGLIGLRVSRRLGSVASELTEPWIVSQAYPGIATLTLCNGMEINDGTCSLSSNSVNGKFSSVANSFFQFELLGPPTSVGRPLASLRMAFTIRNEPNLSGVVYSMSSVIP